MTMPHPPSPSDPTADLPPGSDASMSVGALPESPGTMIGPYRLLQLVGEGGFGSVFLAQQDHPVQRKVALKIIKMGMDTRQVVARFELERQALAILDHPNIAKVFDAGATEAGRPYFVMELCAGERIDRYCDRNNLSIPERLELFSQVCRAVQHAHTKGIIHRDLKPGNVLVSAQDGQPLAKVIDFGIAKATASRLTEQTLFTEQRQIIGTPEYMSPEQAEGSLDIDTRSDVYALGVMLYELLTGCTPFSGRQLRSAAYAEIQRIIREVEPPKPSTRLSQNTETLANVAAKRKTEPRKLGTIIRGELDWIVMKALEKDRQRRYESANALATDIQRYLAGEAVAAAPPSAAYVLRKVVARNKGVVGAGAAIAASLLLGAAAFAWQAKIAREQRDLAVKAEAETRTRADQLKEVSEFQAKMLQGIDPTNAGDQLLKDIRTKLAAALTKAGVPEPQRNARLDVFSKELGEVNATDTAAEMIERTILKPAIGAVDLQFRNQPVVDASLRQTLAELYKTLGKPAEALALQEQALETRRRVLGQDHPDTISSIDMLGGILLEKGEEARAEVAFREAVEKSRRVLGEDNLETLKSVGNLGNLLRSKSQFDEAELLLRASLEGRRRAQGDKHRDTLIAMNTYGFLFIEQGKVTEGEPYWREAYEIGKREFGADDPDVLVWTNNMGGLLGSMGRFADAEPYLRQVVESSRRVHGLEHPTTLTCMTSYANTLGTLGRYADAQAVAREALEARLRTLGADHPDTLFGQLMVGNLLLQGGKFTDAKPFIQAALEGRRRTLGQGHPSTLNAMSVLARLYSDQGNYGEAEALFRDLLDRAKGVWGEDHANRLYNLSCLVEVLLRSDQYDKAEPLARQCLEARRKLLGEDHPDTMESLASIARLHELRGKLDEAATIHRDVLERSRRVNGNDNPRTLSAMMSLARTLRLQGKLAESETLLRESLERSLRVQGEDGTRIAGARIQLGRLLFESQRYSEAEVELLDAQRAVAAAQGLAPSRRVPSLQALVDFYEAWNKADPGKEHDTKAATWRSQLDSVRLERGTLDKK